MKRLLKFRMQTTDKPDVENVIRFHWIQKFLVRDNRVTHYPYEGIKTTFD